MLFFSLNIYPILNKKNISLPVKSCPNSKQPILLLSILAGSNIFEVPICTMIGFLTNHYTNVLRICIHKHSMKFYCTTIFSLIKKIKENKMFLEFQYQILSKRKQCNINLTLFWKFPRWRLSKIVPWSLKKIDVSTGQQWTHRTWKT